MLSQAQACPSPPTIPSPFFRQGSSPGPGLSPRKKGDTHHRGEEAAVLYMFEGSGTEEGGEEEEKGKKGDVWDCMAAGAPRVTSLLDTLVWGQQGHVDHA